MENWTLISEALRAHFAAAPSCILDRSWSNAHSPPALPFPSINLYFLVSNLPRFHHTSFLLSFSPHSPLLFTRSSSFLHTLSFRFQLTLSSLLSRYSLVCRRCCGWSAPSAVVSWESRARCSSAEVPRTCRSPSRMFHLTSIGTSNPLPPARSHLNLCIFMMPWSVLNINMQISVHIHEHILVVRDARGTFVVVAFFLKKQKKNLINMQRW